MRKPAVLAITLVLAVAGAAFVVVAKSPGSCSNPSATHRLILASNAFAPSNLSVKLCDQLTFVNEDTQNYYLAFGVHENHLKYPGFQETSLEPGHELTITATKTGTYEVHDHLRDQAKLQLTVRK